MYIPTKYHDPIYSLYSVTPLVLGKELLRKCMYMHDYFPSPTHKLH